MLWVHFWISITSDHCGLLNTPRIWTLYVFCVIHVSFPTISIDNCEYTYHQVWVSFTFIYFHVWTLQSFMPEFWNLWHIFMKLSICTIRITILWPSRLAQVLILMTSVQRCPVWILPGKQTILSGELSWFLPVASDK